MATCAKCGSQKLSERPCPKCGAVTNKKGSPSMNLAGVAKLRAHIIKSKSRSGSGIIDFSAIKPDMETP